MEGIYEVMTTSGRFDDAMPIPARRLGLSKMHVERGSIAISGRVDPEHDADPALIHALAAATLDAAVDRAVCSALATGHGATIIELKIRFARPFTSTSGIMTCRASVVELGEHLGTASARIADAAENVYVEADATCLIRRP
ncbi:hypothetical protein EPN44_09730 [bacterium]|nr:MAG: hypothetical protein EPN44_09730 [bacterium]